MVTLNFSKIDNGSEGVASGSINGSMVTDIRHVVQVNVIDSFKFSVHFPASGHCNWIRPFCTMVTAYNDNELIFKGRVTNLNTDQSNNGTKQVTCEGEQGFLKDSFIFPGSKNPDATEPEPEPDPEENNEEDIESNQTRSVVIGGHSAFPTPYLDIANLKAGTPVATVLAALVRVHNAFTCSALHLDGYEISGSPSIKNDLELAGKTVYEAMDMIAEDVGMEWRAGRIYKGYFKLEMSPKFGSVKGSLVTGINLQSVSKQESLDGIYTAIMPLGGYGYDEKRLSLASYPCNDETKISRVISGNFMGYDDVDVGSRERPFIKNTSLVKKYGLRIKIVVYDDICVNDPTEYADKRDELLKRAQKDVSELAKDILSFSADAIDFEASTIGGPGPKLSVYDYYNVSDYITGINVKLRLTQKDTNYDDILNPSLTFELDDRTNVAEPIAIDGGSTIINNYTGNSHAI